MNLSPDPPLQLLYENLYAPKIRDRVLKLATARREFARKKQLMSWSIKLIGKPDNVAKALTVQSDKMEGQSKIEYDAALPHMVGLVMQNFGDNTPIIIITANGHGYASAGEQIQRYCAVNIEAVYGNIV